MRTTGIFDDALSLSMGTSGVLYKLKKIVEIDYIADAQDDLRREEYIQQMEKSIIRLKEFSKQFNDQTFTNWVDRHINFVKEDLKRQIHYENISDEAREKLHSEIETGHKRITNENFEFEKMLMTKSYKQGDLTTILENI